METQTELTLGQILERYISPEFIYNYNAGPNVIRTIDDARSFGINCVALAHLVVKDLFDVELPSELDCYELYTDRLYSSFYKSSSNLLFGDLVWFGTVTGHTAVDSFKPEYEQTGNITNWRRFPINHVGVCIAAEPNDVPLILHASRVVGTNSVWSLDDFSKHRYYRQIHGLSRIIT